MYNFFKKIFLSFYQTYNIVSIYYTITEIKQILSENKSIPRVITDKFKITINNIGIFAIKLIQWSISRLKLISDDKNLHDFLDNLDCYYENCPIHDIMYTEQLYLDNFNENIYEKYEIYKDTTIFSGSIGQVYKTKEKNTNQIVAIKCTHPDIENEIILPKILFNIFDSYLTKLSCFSNYKIPLDMDSFFDDLKKQMDLNNEAKNLIKFREIYKDNDYIIFPKPLKYSKNFLIMTYEEGKQFNEIDLSDYKKSKVILLMKIFLRACCTIDNFLHCDLHNGNWKVSEKAVNKLNPVIIYDLGLAINIPENFVDTIIDAIDTKNIKKILDIFLSPEALHFNPYKNDFEFNEIKEKLVLDVNEKLKKCIHNLSIIDTKQILPLLIEKGFIFNSIFLSMFITLTLFTEYLKDFAENTLDFDDNDITENNKYKVQFPQMISFCRTYAIFPKLHDFLDEELKNYLANNKYDIFHQVEKKVDNLINNK